MDFFNRYRDLFGVSSSTPIPNSRLSINNNLFIDKPFVPTYTQSQSINSKLKALKKDYNQLEEQISDFDVKTKTPKRPNSRKVKQLREAREIDMNVRNPHSSFSQYDTKDPLKDKKGSWLKDQQKNLLKHSEINHVFSHQIYEEKPRVKSIRQPNIPKAENFMFGGEQQLPPRRPERLKQSQKPSLSNHSQSLEQLPRTQAPQQQQPQQHKPVNSQKQVVTRALALQRRDQSKRNLRSRREKLSRILSSW